MAATKWESCATLPPLGPGEVCVVHFSLSPRPGNGGPSPWELLDAAERQRAGRFKRPLHQVRFAMGRAGLRAILGHYSGTEPGAIAFAYGPHGKPALAGCGEGLHFNLSHSGDEAVCAISPDRPVGVDIEARRERDGASDIAARYFDPAEAAYLDTRHGEDRLRDFYQFWTAKEALLKGAGGGLTIPLNRCRFQLDQNPLGLEFIELPALASAGWAVHPFSVGLSHAGAVAVAGGVAPLRFVRWETRFTAGEWG